MNPILETGAAAAAASALVNLFKFAWPHAPAWALVLASLVAGIGSLALTTLAGGGVLDDQALAGVVLQGILAALAAAGLDQVAVKAQAGRGRVSQREGTMR